MKTILRKNLGGRPPKMRDGKRVNLYLDEKTLKRAEELGNGNVSAGIRVALRVLTPISAWKEVIDAHLD